MIKLNCIAIDDNPYALMLLIDMIEQDKALNLVYYSTDPVAVLQFLESSNIRPNLVFLDIDMPQTNGLELGDILKDRALLIYVTAHRNYGPEILEQGAVAYLLKPIHKEKFFEAIDKAKRMIQRPEYIFVPGNGKSARLRLDLNQILYVRAYHNFTDIFTSTKKITTYRTLKSLEQDLPQPWFVRIHRSYLINISKIKAADAYTVTMEDDRAIPIGHNYGDLLDQLLKR